MRKVVVLIFCGCLPITLRAADPSATNAPTHIALHSRTLPAVTLGSENCWPRFRFQIPDMPVAAPHDLSADDTAGMMTDAAVPLLPYTAQDDYSRQRDTLELPTIIIDNQFLRVMLYPSLGGRLMSLYDTRAHRELLFNNPVLQFANLAIRNAWFSGGIEWNGPVYGHSLLTASPLYAGIVPTNRGPILRLYEFDRSHDLAWQVDLFLPAGESRLWAHVTATNPNDQEQPFYWWTNIAVPLTPATRVLSPADYAIAHSSTGNGRLPFPHFDGFDGSKPFDYPYAKSVFFRKPGNQKPWSVSVDDQGRGLSHVSTPTLSGRKFFTWGTVPGGKRWMDFLSEDGAGDYIEIQGGVTPTQLQTRPLAAHGRLEWTECFSPVAMDAAAAQQPDYHAACAAASIVIDRLVPDEDLRGVDAFLHAQIHTPIQKILAHGSGWGWLYEKMHGTSISTGLTFENKLSDEERPWVELLTTGTFSPTTLAAKPLSFQVSTSWVAALQQSIHAHGDTWLHEALLGVAFLENGSWADAQRCCEASTALQPNALTYRNLALLHARNHHLEDAQAAYNQAWHLCHDDAHLAVEIADFYYMHHLSDAFAAFVATLPANLAEQDSIMLLRARVALQQGLYAQVRQLLMKDFSAIREGDTSLSELWDASYIQEAETRIGHALTADDQARLLKEHPVPRHLEFRMK